jgi:hypothetical protein
MESFFAFRNCWAGASGSVMRRRENGHSSAHAAERNAHGFNRVEPIR